MESKPKHFHVTVVFRELLIEPVWNRNFGSHIRMQRVRTKLLIEPVWNRNPYPCPPPTTRVGAFNRTSMESKLYWESFPSVGRFSFNRTSMESKLVCGDVEGVSGALLIEPVWNRNFAWSSKNGADLHF